MIRSMTGYGRGHFLQNKEKINIEIKSVNNRFLDFQLYAPRAYLGLEGKVREFLGKFIERGTLNISMNIDTPVSSSISMNFNKLDAYIMLLETVRKKYHIAGALTLEQALSLPELYNHDSGPNKAEKDWPKIKIALQMAAENFDDMRRREGAALEKDILARLKMLDKTLGSIKKRAPQRIVEYKENLQAKVRGLIEKENVDMNRVNSEILLWAEKLDITEEITRFASHLKMFMQALKANKGQTGKKLNFILQEMNREANTIGSKANDSEISHLSMFLKEEIEKIREQIQNIE